MADNHGHPPEHERSPEEERLPRRVGGTPLPVERDDLLGSEPEPPAGPPEGHHPRDPVSARRTERLIALCYGAAFVAGMVFIVTYVMFPTDDINSTLTSNYWLGGTLTVALLGLAAGMTLWVRGIMPRYEVAEDHPGLRSDEKERREFAEFFMRGADESGLTKRPLMRRSLLLALVPLGLAPILLLRDLDPGDLGDAPEKLRHTAWDPDDPRNKGKQLRLVIDGTAGSEHDAHGTPLKADALDRPGSFITAVPEGYEHDLNEIAKTAVIVIKFNPEDLKAGVNQNWTVDGIVAYSKICTHVGCAAALYETDTHHILCPCHQSTFDATDGAKVLFGPAGRPLPQLPLAKDAEGYLIAADDFQTPVGPAFWEMGDT